MNNNKDQQDNFAKKEKIQSLPTPYYSFQIPEQKNQLEKKQLSSMVININPTNKTKKKYEFSSNVINTRKKSKKKYQISSMIINPKKGRGFGIKSNYSFTYIPLKNIPKKETQFLLLKNLPNEKQKIKIIYLKKNPNVFSKKNQQNNQRINSVTKPKISKFEIFKVLRKPKNDEGLLCKCKNTNCLKLFCGCFKTLGYCSPKCKCINCLNTKEYENERQFVIKSMKKIDKNSFKKKKNFMQEYKGFKINCLGCICSKGCLVNYCVCKKNNGKCSSLCKCLNCVNDKIDIDRDTVVKIVSEFRGSRKKGKLVIDFDRKVIQYMKSNNKKSF